VRLTELRLQDFRNLARVELQPHPRFNVFAGLNGQGKTNLIEAVHLLAALKSFRALRNRDLIRTGQDAAIIEATVDRQAHIRDLRLTVRSTGRRVELNDRVVKDLSLFFGTLGAVTFTPEDVGVLKGAPADRRLFIDRIIFNLMPGYGATALAYEEAVRQRNALLRQDTPPDPAMLAAWEEPIARHGAELLYQRLRWLAHFTPRLRQAFARIFGPARVVTIGYQSTLAEADRGAGSDEVLPAQPELQRALGEQLRRERPRDLARGATQTGPHRDDFLFLLDGEPVRTHASQGQHRALVLASRISEIEAMTEQTGDPPILLLDDVSSELDPERNARLFEFLDEFDGQVFITTTDRAFLHLAGASSAFTVDAGEVRHDPTPS
jgi:DNA replication and repair protein RecF